MIRIIVLLIFQLISSNSIAKELKCTKFKNLPTVLPGCPGEGCGVTEFNIVINTIELRKEPKLNSPKVGMIKKCENFKAFTSVTKIKSFGKARIVEFSKYSPKTTDPNLAKKDDVVIYLRYIGEGWHQICIGDKVISIDGEKLKIQTPSKYEVWFKLSSQEGIEGYTNKHSFYIGDDDHRTWKQFCPKGKVIRKYYY